MRMKRLLVIALFALLFSGRATADTEQQFIEHRGDRYVINVEAMAPDREMTLMDVLQACPELISDTGKRITQNYEIRIDNVTLMMDDATVLEALKASEISTIEVYLYTSVAISGGGDAGIIDIYLKLQADGHTSGKLLLEGSTRGNGKAYADVITRSGSVTLRGYALANLEYAHGPLAPDGHYSSRQGTQNVHLNVDWDISTDDNLKVKLSEGFLDSKQRLFTADYPFQTPTLERNWMGTASYTRTLNERGATLLAEGGADYLNTRIEDVKQRELFTYYFTEANIPCLDNSLNILAGWEIDYYNAWMRNVDRQQTMFNDLYLQIDYAKGPWVLALGNRFRIINYWHRLYDASDATLWDNSRTEHSCLVSAGYKAGRHFVQGLFNRDYNTPLIDYLYAGYDADNGCQVYLSDFDAAKLYSVEARYAYQQPGFSCSGSVLHRWAASSPVADEKYTGVRATATWRRGPFLLTAGADYFHWQVDNPDYIGNRYYNFFNLRLLPTLLLNGGWRFSARLFCNSRRNLLVETPAHLYASVKVSKELGRHCTVSLDCHDLAGAPRVPGYLVGHSYDNRALTLGFTYRL